jgi:hypothetical protein
MAASDLLIGLALDVKDWFEAKLLHRPQAQQANKGHFRTLPTAN